MKSQLDFQLLRSWSFYSIAPLFKGINLKKCSQASQLGIVVKNL